MQLTTEQNIPVQAELLAAVRSYLGQRPHDEVAGLIAGLNEAAMASAQRQQEANNSKDKSNDQQGSPTPTP